MEIIQLVLQASSQMLTICYILTSTYLKKGNMGCYEMALEMILLDPALPETPQGIRTGVSNKGCTALHGTY